ncbi:MAG: hypothetical protein ABJB04_08815 [Betaproteobacteria bacterium]
MSRQTFFQFGMGHMNFGILFIAIALAIVSGCASVPAEPAPSPLSIAVQPGKIAEECFVLAEGERIDYQFESTTAVDFNLHTHRGNEIVLPVNVRATRAQSGTYSSPRREEYCMMWTNSATIPAHVTGDWRRMRR